MAWNRRLKCGPYIRRQSLAFRVFGEIRPLIDRVVLPIWMYEDAPPMDVVCDSHEVACRQIALLTEGDMLEYENYCRGAPLPMPWGD